jgi:hypothetical protein
MASMHTELDSDDEAVNEMHNNITSIIEAFLEADLPTTMQILIFMTKDVIDDNITVTSSLLMNTKVNVAITDNGLLLFSSNPDFVIPYHMMNKRQIGLINDLLESMTQTNVYITGSKMTQGYFAAPLRQAFYVIPSHHVLHACVMLLKDQNLPTSVYEFMLHRILCTCNWQHHVVTETCKMLKSNRETGSETTSRH